MTPDVTPQSHVTRARHRPARGSCLLKVVRYTCYTVTLIRTSGAYWFFSSLLFSVRHQVKSIYLLLTGHSSYDDRDPEENTEEKIHGSSCVYREEVIRG